MPENTLLNFTFDQIMETNDDDLLDHWSTLRVLRSVTVEGILKNDAQISTEGDIRQLFYEICHVNQAAKNVIDLSSLNFNTETRKVYVDVIGDHAVHVFCKNFATQYIIWDSNTSNNRATSDSTPVFGPILLGRYTAEHLKKAIIKEFGTQATENIAFISAKPNVTTLFFKDTQDAIAITSKVFFIIGDLDNKHHVVKYTMTKSHKEKIPHVKVKGWKRKPEILPLLALINRKCINEIGAEIQIIDIGKNLQQKFLGYIVIYVPKSSTEEKVRTAINNKIFMGMKVTAIIPDKKKN